MIRRFCDSQPRFVVTGAIMVVLLCSCARLPYTTNVVHEDARVVVSLQKELEQVSYSHPAQLNEAEVAAILEGFSFRPKQRMPLRWFAEENPPKPVFRPCTLNCESRVSIPQSAMPS
jgi:hypothetical protein